MKNAFRSGELVMADIESATNRIYCPDITENALVTDNR